MHSGHSKDWPSVPVGAIGQSPIHEWALMERGAGVFIWNEPDSIDDWVAAAQSNGVSLFHRTAGTPLWATSDVASCNFSSPPPIVCTAMVSNIKYWDSWWTALVTRYQGQIQVYDLWNEPYNPKSFTGTVAQMVTLTRHEHDIIRSIDPSALIVSPSANPAYMDQYWTAGGVTDVDVVGFHAYPPSTIHTGNVAEDEITSLVAGMKSVMAKHRLVNKPLWDTEGSWGNEGTGAITDPDLQTSFLARYYLMHWSLGVTRFYWYVWDNPSTGNGWGGLLDNNGNPTQAAIAYEQVYEWMVGATMTQACTMASDFTWTCAFERPGGYRALAIWNNMTSKQYRVTSEYSQYRDLSGNVRPAQGSVPIGSKPILVEGEFVRVP